MISVEDCEMSLIVRAGQSVIECLDKNISIIELKYNGNKFD